MAYRNFNVNIIVRLILIIFTSIWLTSEFGDPQKAYTKFLIISLLIIQSGLFVRYFNKINKELVRFLEVLKVNDSSYRFSSDLKGNFTELAKILNNTADLIENTRIEKEKQYHFLQFVIEQINIGLIAYNNAGKIQFVNDAFKKLFKLNGLQDLADLEKLDKQFYLKLLKTKPQDLFQHKIKIDGSFYNLLIQKKQFKFNSEYINLVSFQNISAELDKKEMEAWQKLIRVLTHEIMNSIAPITNLTYSIRRSLIENIETETIKKDVIQEAIEDTEIIERRSNSLMQFVENYRKLTKIGKIQTTRVNVNELVEHSLNLFKEDLKKYKIDYEINIESDIELEADEKLLEQALINIIKNAIEALINCNNSTIIVSADYVENNLILTIKDNGIGIEEDKLDDIFIPFYSSKETGSGIGLSLVKQIINLHKGTISVDSKIGEGCTIKIKL
ncbi:MAG: GHKL domain-containing protein [Bacteroidales bacterium]|nr:GHKL domain-containing protein [Bacteroidales bacterium]